MENLFVKHRQGKLTFSLPSGWTVLTFATFDDHPGDKDVERISRRALNNPIGSSPLKCSLSPSDTVAILIEDHTRKSPKKAVLKILLDELAAIGIARENISVIVALGTHKGLSSEELKAVYGDEAVEGYTFVNHDCYAQDLVPVARLKTGTIVKINKKVHDASFKIGVGSIFPHPMNGFGGGGKILYPGVSDFDSTLEHHLKYSFRDGSHLGALEGNRFYEEVSDIAKIAGLNFIVNSVLDHNDHLFSMVAGNPIEAHRAGVEQCREIITRKFQKRADVTIISSFPYTEGPQIMKPFAPASLITRKNGVVILVAECTSPIPDAYVEGCERFRLKYGHNLRKSLFEFFDRNRRIIEEGSPELNMSVAQALLAQNDHKVIMVTRDIPSETVERLGFYFAEDFDQAIAMSANLVSSPEVHVIPAGGVILPILEDN